ncbi:ArsR/SmtB family transcription factor [Derxia gummosa]|uniref:ArsR/SmtB family transcription factor n=1 Tax=Derxia gummosa DSM 723 TaxID=1121388 RepID=A0A8B6XB40_9BURK|nr:metalloregulator ArsR/SmtB family transcription factor [Derxia gummosa]
MPNLPPEAMEQVAAYFQALAEPTRLLILNLLRDGERNVGELAEQCGCSSANVSRHLSLLMRHGFVVREGRGTSVYYRIADASVYALCDLVCGNIARQLDQRARSHAAFASANAAGASGAGTDDGEAAPARATPDAG